MEEVAPNTCIIDVFVKCKNFIQRFVMQNMEHD